MRQRLARALTGSLLSAFRRVPAPLLGRSVVVAGQRLDPHVQLGLRLYHLSGRPPLESLPPHQARAEANAILRHLNPGPPEPLALVSERTFAGPAGPLRVRRYRPTGRAAAPRPALVFLHGGGHVVGDLDTHEPLCRLLAARSGVEVIAVAYRLAPEARFPAAFDDALAAFRWVRDEAASLGVDPARIAIGGDSAGGNLAAAVALAVARSGEPGPALQLLLYPLVDATTALPGAPHRRPSYDLFGAGYGLDVATIHWYRSNYLGPAGDPSDVRISPLLAADLTGLAPAWVGTAGYDPLRDEGAAWVDALNAAGGRAVHAQHPGLIHGFATFTGVFPEARRAVERAAGALRAALQ
ncbi:MAG: hypothetical protein CVU56_06800 [Deltaproteobacteria bacterium HGW-Deltaproteobacteria-14]|jgi:acetyl esterase|nr:MAG: hypothetical protein CVU56_06800 [Deltaproteobacteria bacterium HGW-Deltaproteobacteria-14]